MSITDHFQGTICEINTESYLLTWIEAFLIDRKAQNMTKGTLRFYQWKLKYFMEYCETQHIKDIRQIDPNTIRYYLLDLENKGHNDGGIHACYRTLKTFLLWWENEIEPENWSNPIKKVKAPRVAIEPLEPACIEDVKQMIAVCPKNTLTGERDRAMMLVLLDTGVRASELLQMDLVDVNQVTGEVKIRIGKGRKPRNQFLGSKTRKALRAYLRYKTDSSSALWVTKTGERVSYWGLVKTIKQRAIDANVKPPSLHSFRRWFALTCLRAGVDVYSLQLLMGHADLQVLRRYLKQTSCDLREAHQKASPVDNL